MPRAAGALLAGLLLAAPGHAHNLPAAVSAALKNYRIPVSSVSMDVRELDSGRSVLSVNSDVPRNPASAIKILTTLSALEILGPNYQWETRYFAGGRVRDGVLEGDLVIQGSGDPFLTSDRFWRQVLTLRQLGIHTIDGDLVFDNRLFDLPQHDRSGFDNRPTRLYNVGPDAVLVNFSASRFVFQPVANRVIVYTDPPLAGLEIQNHLKIADGRCIAPGSGWRYRVERNDAGLSVTFNGAYRRNCGEHEFSRSLFSNHEYAWRLFRFLWTGNGGQFSGDFRTGQAPEDARLLATHSSEPLADIVTGINKFSNNVMARQLMLTLDAGEEGRPATVDGARRRMQDWLAAGGLSGDGLFVDNGAGLSRRTRITSGGLSALLGHGWNSNYQAEFLSSLPLAALDGTMRKRLGDSSLRGRARIKTGLVNGVRSMAGYVNSRSGKTYSVVLMIESRAVTFSRGNAIQDALLEWIHDL